MKFLLVESGWVQDVGSILFADQHLLILKCSADPRSFLPPWQALRLISGKPRNVLQQTLSHRAHGIRRGCQYWILREWIGGGISDTETQPIDRVDISLIKNLFFVGWKRLWFSWHQSWGIFKELQFGGEDRLTQTQHWAGLVTLPSWKHLREYSQLRSESKLWMNIWKAWSANGSKAVDFRNQYHRFFNGIKKDVFL